jgi:hypothetical protein
MNELDRIKFVLMRSRIARFTAMEPPLIIKREETTNGRSVFINGALFIFFPKGAGFF